MTDHTVIAPQGPQKIGKYRIRAKLGEGAMGVVYDAHDQDIDRFVAIKTVHKHLIDAAGEEDWLTRFSREAQAAGRVLHPNLVTIFDYLEQDGRPYLVMERLEAKTLEDRMSEPQSLTLTQVAAIFGQILDGLSAIHEAAIVHRDMKPANIMLTAKGGVKLTDFGIARFTKMDRTSAGMIGTPAYMAPEQFSGDEVCARSDVYATGIILYEILTGRQPYRGGGITAVMLASKGESVPPPSTLAPDLPAALDAVVMTAICPDPNGRYASAVEMRTALLAAVSTHGATLTASPEVGAPRSLETMIGRLSLTTMLRVEESLVARIGPIGKLLARRAAETAVTQEDLLQQILGEVSDPSEREVLRQTVASLMTADPGRAQGKLNEGDLKSVIAALTPHLGPIAGTLVRRQAARSPSLSQLLDTMTEAIPDTNDRAAFLEAAQTQIAKGPRHA
ncbi:serine/threonine-protein kinase [uncultured Tateyamaria sp.]|uniref:serine/threonine-protein kinase n=1 Tax=uncultured Tateyamaria sp. TaxID=455651 RepID=UPI00262289C4|nr:serine/threonine-protein kinase [uncultured Tateyamaria sp.]